MSLTIYDLSDINVKHTLVNPPYRSRAPFDEYTGGGLDRYSIFQYSKVIPGLSALELVSRDYGKSNLINLQSDNDWYTVYIIYRIKKYSDDDINDMDSYTYSIQSMVEDETGFNLTLECNDICYFNCHENNLSFKEIIDYLEDTFSMNFNSDFAIYVEKD